MEKGKRCTHDTVLVDLPRNSLPKQNNHLTLFNWGFDGEEEEEKKTLNKRLKIRLTASFLIHRRSFIILAVAANCRAEWKRVGRGCTAPPWLAPVRDRAAGAVAEAALAAFHRGVRV